MNLSALLYLGDTSLAMSRENVEVARRQYESFNATGMPDFRFLDPQIQWHTSDRALGQSPITASSGSDASGPATHREADRQS